LYVVLNKLFRKVGVASTNPFQLLGLFANLYRWGLSRARFTHGAVTRVLHHINVETIFQTFWNDPSFRNPIAGRRSNLKLTSFGRSCRRSLFLNLTFD
jgi:hypothetical protein